MPHPQNPFETPRLKGIRLVQGTLRVVTAVQCFGMAASWLHQRRVSPVAEWVARTWEANSEQLLRIENGAAGLLIACGLLTLLRPATLILIPVILYQIAAALAVVAVSDRTDAALAPAQHAARIAVPLALMIVDFWPPRVRATLPMSLAAVTLLRVAAAVTFAGSGLLALSQSQRGGPLADLFAAVAQNLFQTELSSSALSWWLGLLGAVEIALAISLVSSRSRFLTGVMVVWGFLAAHSWTLAYGRAGYDLTLMQAADGGAPLTVLLFWLTSVREQRPVFLPEPARDSQSSRP